MKVISYHSNEGTRVGLLIKTLRKYHYVLLIDNPIRVSKVALSEEKFFRDVEYKGAPYPVKRALRHIKRMIKDWNGGMKNVSKDVKEIFLLPKEEGKDA
jgi:hypothetical protein